MKRMLIGIVALAVCPLGVQGGKVKVWYHNSPNSYDKADVKQLVMTTEGALRLARQMRPLADLDAAHVWAVAEDQAGNLYVATGNEGKLFRLGKDGQTKLIYQSEDSQILSLAIA